MNAHAFDRAVNPFGAALQAVFGSDNAHWDVTDMNEVLVEAHESVDRGVITEDDFRSFVFANPVALHAGMNRAFFRGTNVEHAVDRLLGPMMTRTRSDQRTVGSTSSISKPSRSS